VVHLGVAYSGCTPLFREEASSQRLMTEGSSRRACLLLLMARWRVSPSATGVLLLVKSVLLSKDPFVLQQHRREFAAFPNDPTSDQFFSPDKFEAYRFLGYTAASQLADRLQAEGNLETAELLRRLKREFCSATDAAAILGELATELKQLDEPDALDRLSNADQFSIASLLRRWNRLNESDSISIQNALFDLKDFRSRLRKLHQSVKFRHHRAVLEKLDWKLALAAKEIAAVPKERPPRTQKKG
jgi:hypothetical protein